MNFVLQRSLLRFVSGSISIANCHYYVSVHQPTIRAFKLSINSNYPSSVTEWHILQFISLSGILTKPDLVDKGTEETVVRIMHNEVIPLTKGYMVVRCRGQREIMENVSPAEAIETENDFFENHAHFK